MTSLKGLEHFVKDMYNDDGTVLRISYKGECPL